MSTVMEEEIKRWTAKRKTFEYKPQPSIITKPDMQRDDAFGPKF